MSEVNPFSGIAQLLIMYSVLPIVLGILLIFALRNVDNVHGEDESGKINFKLIATALKNPGIWLASLMMLFAYIISVSFYYFAPYATSAFGVSVLAAAIISSSSTYIRPISAIGSGFLADRINSSKVYLIGEVLLAIGLLFVIFTPVGTSIIPVLIGCVIVYFAVFMNQSMYKVFINKEASEQRVLWVSRITTGIICVGGVIVANLMQNLIDIVYLAGLFYSAAVFFPVVFGVYWKRGNAEGCFAAILTSVAVGFFVEYGCGGAWLGLPSNAIAALAGILVLVVVSLCTPPPSEEQLKGFESV